MSWHHDRFTPWADSVRGYWRLRSHWTYLPLIAVNKVIATQDRLLACPQHRVCGWIEQRVQNYIWPSANFRSLVWVHVRPMGVVLLLSSKVQAASCTAWALMLVVELTNESCAVVRTNFRNGLSNVHVCGNCSHAFWTLGHVKTALLCHCYGLYCVYSNVHVAVVKCVGGNWHNSNFVSRLKQEFFKYPWGKLWYWKVDRKWHHYTSCEGGWAGQGRAGQGLGGGGLHSTLSINVAYSPAISLSVCNHFLTTSSAELHLAHRPISVHVFKRTRSLSACIQGTVICGLALIT